MPLFITAAGWVGAVLVLIAYGLSSLGRLAQQSATYQVLNIVGAAGLVVNSGAQGAIPSAAVNVIWAVVGLVAIARNRAGVKSGA